MGFDFLPNPLDLFSDPMGPIDKATGVLSGSDAAAKRAKDAAGDEWRMREESKRKQLGFLDQTQGPSMTPEMERRLKALEDDSQAGPLSQDKYFQADRANLVQGGQQALSGIQNEQAAHGTQGGFSNQGSVHDVYDRLGSQLAQLGQNSTALKEQKSGAVAQARQNFHDSQIQFANAQNQARAAIEAGDASAAIEAMKQAYNANEANIAARNQFLGGAVGLAGSLVGDLVPGPWGKALSNAGKAMPGQVAQTYGAVPTGNERATKNPYAAASTGEYADHSNMPWAYQRSGSRGY